MRRYLKQKESSRMHDQPDASTSLCAIQHALKLFFTCCYKGQHTPLFQTQQHSVAMAIHTCIWSHWHGPLTACIFEASTKRGIIASLVPGKRDAASWLLCERFSNLLVLASACLLVLASSESVLHVLHGHTSNKGREEKGERASEGLRE